MKRLLFFAAIFSIFSCSKSVNVHANHSAITYEIFSGTNEPFSSVSFFNPNIQGGKMIETTPFKGTGLLVIKDVDFTIGSDSAEVYAVNPGSGDWKVRIKSSHGVLIEQSPSLVNGAYQVHVKVAP